MQKNSIHYLNTALILFSSNCLNQKRHFINKPIISKNNEENNKKDESLKKILKANNSFNDIISKLTLEINTLEIYLKTNNCKEGVNELLLTIDKSILLGKALSLPESIHTVKNIEDIYRIIKFASISPYHLTKKIKFHYFQHILDFRKTINNRNKIELLYNILKNMRKQLIINNEIRIKKEMHILKINIEKKFNKEDTTKK